MFPYGKLCHVGINQSIEIERSMVDLLAKIEFKRLEMLEKKISFETLTTNWIVSFLMLVTHFLLLIYKNLCNPYVKLLPAVILNLIFIVIELLSTDYTHASHVCTASILWLCEGRIIKNIVWKKEVEIYSNDKTIN